MRQTNLLYTTLKGHYQVRVMRWLRRTLSKDFKEKLALSKDFTFITAPKTIFPKSWNIMESYKILSKYNLFNNFLEHKKIVFPISEQFKSRAFWSSVNMVFHARQNIILHQLFGSNKRPYFLSPKSSKQELFRV